MYSQIGQNDEVVSFEKYPMKFNVVIGLYFFLNRILANRGMSFGTSSRGAFVGITMRASGFPEIVKSSHMTL